ncbi:hypothetical protein M8C21_025013 [Ambrosia artemisiifolia]|uniref:Uncharacterized protein n=1 Tax=Ambrosia artemisiifolia TaxID=4212 RepID=A0AAD5G4D5_AMBAR|nr:hypothetical protein M8C21_025013 [Ambrosia artemisiifolia]
MALTRARDRKTIVKVSMSSGRDIKVFNGNLKTRLLTTNMSVAEYFYIKIQSCYFIEQRSAYR